MFEPDIKFSFELINTQGNAPKATMVSWSHCISHQICRTVFESPMSIHIITNEITTVLVLCIGGGQLNASSVFNHGSVVHCKLNIYSVGRLFWRSERIVISSCSETWSYSHVYTCIAAQTTSRILELQYPLSYITVHSTRLLPRSVSCFSLLVLSWIHACVLD